MTPNEARQKAQTLAEMFATWPESVFIYGFYIRDNALRRPVVTISFDDFQAAYEGRTVLKRSGPGWINYELDTGIVIVECARGDAPPNLRDRGRGELVNLTPTPGEPHGQP